jgi:hypothetical protein
VPHVTLKSIANNPNIKEGMSGQQIDAAIAKHAETETLYDQPYEDNKRMRVCGPFTGAEQSYEKLKQALRADIDEDAWQSLYSTVSRPFDKPGSGKIAVKIINHYGDEMLKVFDV